MTKIFSKDYLVNELHLPRDAEEEQIIGHGRWNLDYEIVFQDKDGKYYQTTYRIGSTELQDEEPWEYEKEVTCYEVEKKPVTVMKWVQV